MKRRRILTLIFAACSLSASALFWAEGGESLETAHGHQWPRPVLASEEGCVTRPWLGVSGMLLNEDIVARLSLPVRGGLLVEDVERGSPAAQAGLRVGNLDVTVDGIHWLVDGDILVSLDGQPILSPQPLLEAMNELQAGQTVLIEVLRNGTRFRTSAVLREHPSGSLLVRHIVGQGRDLVVPCGPLTLGPTGHVRF
ncbi:MAG: PDZ domain-containing protein [Nitrospirota bacterium]